MESPHEGPELLRAWALSECASVRTFVNEPLYLTAVQLWFLQTHRVSLLLLPAVVFEKSAPDKQGVLGEPVVPKAPTPHAGTGGAVDELLGTGLVAVMALALKKSAG